ncbi:pyruvate, phosphate dikinase [Gordonia sp. (in: high G+C Gram-positive bacteria)]|uniref:pyruvate, phosphate dikinase n=1 Tax=Gordonia sp. (in: high G+C Gram-positive bacteria) TaxID=84139 RepID=UPI003F9AD296
MTTEASRGDITSGTHDDVVLLDGLSPGDRELLGGKAYSVNRMRAIGLPVPLAFALPTSVCGVYHQNSRSLPDAMWDQVKSAVTALEDDTGRTFGSGPSPLLVSVRSGAAQSMPGMMDTVLNLGLTPDLVEALTVESGDADWAQNTWSRFRRSYADIVLGDDGGEPPHDPWDQLRAAIGAVFDSWTNERVRAYRERHALGEGGGTAVTVQAMAFGNRDEESGTGVLFSRDPNTGEPVLYGEWLSNAQGEDVVSGESTPIPIAELAQSAPALHAELSRIATVLESEYRDLVDIEFTVESGRLYMLQCRAGKRAPGAAVRIAVDLVGDGVITESEALDRVTEEHVQALAGATRIETTSEPLAVGLGASPGVAHGHVAHDFNEVIALEAEGKQAILATTFTAPDDVPAMFASAGVLTEVGGATSHAALVCREIGLPCVVGAGPGVVDRVSGQVIMFDGNSGKVYADGETGTASASADEHVRTLIGYAEAADAKNHPICRFASK